MWCDAGTLLEMLHPLQRLASAGAAVLILHHPRKRPADEGNAAAQVLGMPRGPVRTIIVGVVDHVDGLASPPAGPAPRGNDRA